MNNNVFDYEVNDRSSFIHFLNLLQKDLAENPQHWENKTLPDFLEALERYSEDVQGYFDNMKIDRNADEPNWNIFATLF